MSAKLHRTPGKYRLLQQLFDNRWATKQVAGIAK